MDVRRRGRGRKTSWWPGVKHGQACEPAVHLLDFCPWDVVGKGVEN